MLRLLEQAIEKGMAVRVWYVGLENVELHSARVRARVAAGGHDIPEAKIRARSDQSRLNLIPLLPELTHSVCLAIAPTEIVGTRFGRRPNSL